MTFAATKTSRCVMGDKFVDVGYYTQGNGDTGGTITTSLNVIEYFEATAATKLTVSNGTPATVVIVTADPAENRTGYWKAIGR